MIKNANYEVGKKIATRDAYGQSLAALGAVNPAVVVLDADLSKSTKSYDFGKVYPERFFNIGIAEQNLMGIAAGLAQAGKIPFASTFAVFGALRPMEQIRNAICYPKLSVKIAVTHAGLTVGEDGASHQAIEDIAVMRSVPNMTVVVPADAQETYQAVWAAAQHDGPVYLRMGRAAVPVIFDSNYRFKIGQAPVVRPGGDVAILACGIMAGEALSAAGELAKDGIQARVVNVSTIKPLDVEAVVAAARDCGAVVTAEEASIIGGLGGAVAEALAEHYPTPLVRVGVRDTFGESGTPAALLEKYSLTARDIYRAAKEAVGKKR